MTQNPFRHESIPQSNKSQSNKSQSNRARTADDYWQTIAPEIRATLTAEQTVAIRAVLTQATPQPNPKLVDLRFSVDLILARFYVVLFVGKDRRQQKRPYLPARMARVGNIVAAVILLLGLNLLISLFIFLFAYLTKSAIGIDLFPSQHLADQVEKI
jgi:hypothetical protein